MTRLLVALFLITLFALFFYVLISEARKSAYAAGRVSRQREVDSLSKEIFVGVHFGSDSIIIELTRDNWQTRFNRTVMQNMTDEERALNRVKTYGDNSPVVISDSPVKIIYK